MFLCFSCVIYSYRSASVLVYIYIDIYTIVYEFLVVLRSYRIYFIFPFFNFFYIINGPEPRPAILTVCNPILDSCELTCSHFNFIISH